MSCTAKVSLAVVALLVAGVLGAILFVSSGVYDIGADDHHTKFVFAVIERLRDRSIERRAKEIEAVPTLENTSKILAGARRYAELCAGCHLAPGVTKSAIRRGMYPLPPSLAQEAVPDARTAFWTVKHGIKMSAMPAWGKSLDDVAIWDIVAFLREMPNLSPEAYQQMSTSQAE